MAARPPVAAGAGGTLVVGVLTTSYPRFPGDHAGSFVEDQVNVLIAAGHTVELFAAADDGTGGTTRAGAVTVTRVGVPATRERLFYGAGAPEMLEQGGPRAWLQAVAFWGGLCRSLRQRAGHLDALVAHWLIPCGAAALSVAPTLPLRAYAHSGDVSLLERLPGGSSIARWLAEQARAPSSQLLFVTEALRRRFAALVGRSVGGVEPLVPSASVFHPATAADRRAARCRLGLQQPTILSVGRLVPIKGFALLIRACALLARDGGPPPALVIIGDGPLRPALESLARRLGVRLLLPGFIPRPALASWLAAADVYTQPSLTMRTGRTEGLPVATLEALATGLPVVVPGAGGFLELPPERVTWVAPGEAVALANALRCHLGRAAQFVTGA